jgi:hypothetical protein
MLLILKHLKNICICFGADFLRCVFAHFGMHCCNGQFLGHYKTLNHSFKSCSLSLCLFRSRFRAKLSSQCQWKCFSSLQYPLSVQTDLPFNAFPQTEHTKPTTLHHKMSHKVRCLSDRLLICCTCVWVVTSVNYKLWYSRPLNEQTDGGVH